MKKIIIILVASVFIGCDYNPTVNHQKSLFFGGDTRKIVDTVYLNDNGVHVDLVLPTDGEYISYGWGSAHFFMNIPTWNDASYKDFLHVSNNREDVVIREIRHYNKQDHWIPVLVDKYQLKMLHRNVKKSYVLDSNGNKIRVIDTINNGWYYKAKGKYSLLYTCNTWTNEMLKKSDLYARKRAIFSKDIINLYD